MPDSTVGRARAAHQAKMLLAIGRQSHWILLGKIIFVGAGFGTTVLLARILGPASVGRFQLGLAVIQIASVFTIAGLDKGMVRFLPILAMGDSGESRRLFVRNIALTLVLSVTLATILYQAAPALAVAVFNSDEMTPILRTFCYFLPISSVLRLASGSLIGLKRADLQSHVDNILIPSAFLVTLTAVYFLSGSTEACINARSVVHLVPAFGLSVYLLRHLPDTHDPLKPPRIGYRQFVAFSIPVMFTSLIFVLLGKMDTIMLGYFLEAEQVGIYAVAIRVAAIVIVGLQVLLPVVRPYLSELFARDDLDAVEKLIKPVTKWLVFSGLSVFAIILILRLEILGVFGATFLAGSSALVILGVGHLGNILSGPNGQLLVMSGRQKMELVNTGTLLALNFMLNWILIPRLGINGAAIATATSVISVNVVRSFEIYKLYGIHPYSWSCLKVVGAVIVAAVGGFVAREAMAANGTGDISTLVLTCIWFASVLFGCVWYFGIDQNDRLLLGARSKIAS